MLSYGFNEIERKISRQKITRTKNERTDFNLIKERETRFATKYYHFRLILTTFAHPRLLTKSQQEIKAALCLAEHNRSGSEIKLSRELSEENSSTSTIGLTKKVTRLRANESVRVKPRINEGGEGKLCRARE